MCTRQVSFLAFLGSKLLMISMCSFQLGDGLFTLDNNSTATTNISRVGNPYNNILDPPLSGGGDHFPLVGLLIGHSMA